MTLVLIHAATLKITVSADQIAMDTAFRHCLIPFARIVQLTSYTASDGKGGNIRVTILSTADQYITLTDALPNYCVLRDYITSRTDPKAIVQAEF